MNGFNWYLRLLVFVAITIVFQGELLTRGQVVPVAISKTELILEQEHLLEVQPLILRGPSARIVSSL